MRRTWTAPSRLLARCVLWKDVNQLGHENASMGRMTWARQFSQKVDDEDKSTDQTAKEDRSWRGRAKTFAVEYGRVGLVTHTVLSTINLSILYAGVVSGVDVNHILEVTGMSSTAALAPVSDAASAGSFVLTYAIYKLAAPIRWPMTFAVTPMVMRALRRRGYMVPSNLLEKKETDEKKE